MSKHSLAANYRYQKFIRARNKALERLHLATQLKLSAMTNEVVIAVKNLLKSRYRFILQYGIYTPQGKQELESLQKEIHRMFDMAIPYMTHLMSELRKQVYTLSYAGEAEAIGQALGQKKSYNLPSGKIKQQASSETFTGGSVEERVQLALNRLARKVLNQVETSAINDELDFEFLDKLERLLPKKKTVAVEQRNITLGPKLKEADGDPIGPKEDMSLGFVDEETWDEMVDAYKDEFVPGWRGPEQSFMVNKKPDDKEVIYAWELEQEVTQDFVYQVRLGQVDAAKENGITDYVWVAVVDSRTDECCLWRDGLTTQEIERRLKTDHSDDECQTIVPPAHFNCATAGHKITTLEGVKLIESIKPGDKVLTHKNRFREVNRCLQSKVKKTFLLELSNGTTLRVTPEHPLMTKDGRWIEAKNIIIGDELVRENDISHIKDSKTLSREISRFSMEDHGEL